MITLMGAEIELITNILEDTLYKLKEGYADAIQEWDNDYIPVVKYRLKCIINKLNKE